MAEPTVPLDDPVRDHLRREFVRADADATVDGLLSRLRREGDDHAIFYVYVLDDEAIAGVVPIRRLLTADPQARLGDLVEGDLVTLPADATLLEAIEAFLDHRFLAFPVVDEAGRMLGVVDVHLFTPEAIDVAERRRVDQVLEWIGLHATQARQGSIWTVARSRLVWLSATVAGGLGAAAIAAFHRATLQEALVLAFFLTLVLGLAESVSIQSLTLALERRRVGADGGAGRELATALLLGGALGSVVGTVAWWWQGQPLAGAVVGGSILVTVTLAAMIGTAVPFAVGPDGGRLHVAAGPLTLMLVDVTTLTLYFGLGAMLLA